MSKKSILKDILCNGVVRYSNARTYLLIIWIISLLAASFCCTAVRRFGLETREFRGIIIILCQRCALLCVFVFLGPRRAFVVLVFERVGGSLSALSVIVARARARSCVLSYAYFLVDLGKSEIVYQFLSHSRPHERRRLRRPKSHLGRAAWKKNNRKNRHE